MPRFETDTAVVIDFLNAGNAAGNGHATESHNGSNGTHAASGNGHVDESTLSQLWQLVAWEDSAPGRLRRLRPDSRQRDVADAISRTLRPGDKRSLKEITRGELPHPALLIDTDNEPQASDVRRWLKIAKTSLPRWKRDPSAKLSRLTARVVEPLLETQSPPDVALAAWRIIASASHLDDEVLLGLWLKLLQSSRQLVTGTLSRSESSHEWRPAECTANLQLAELHVVVGLLFRHITGAGQIASRGCEWADEILEASTDHDGTPHADWWPTLGAGVMSALRILWLDAWWGEGRLLSKRFRRRLKRVLKRVVALNELRDHRDVVLWGLRALESGSKRNRAALDGKPANHSGWANLGILRTGWDDDADLCAVGYTGDVCRVKTDIGAMQLFDDTWTIEASMAGEPVAFDDWSLNCWNSDKDGDYLELGRDAAGVNLIRQIFLSRKDSFLFLADSVRADAGAIAYRSTIPMSGEWKTSHDGLTRELALSRQNIRVRLVPLSLPHNVADGTNGRIETSDQSLRLSAESQQPGLCAAVLLEWSPALRKSPVDWTVLTIAEEGKRLDSGDAFGARIRMGDKQFVFFHSLTKSRMPRTVMGHHTPYESVIAKFEGGNFVPLLNVEAGQGESA